MLISHHNVSISFQFCFRTSQVSLLHHLFFSLIPLSSVPLFSLSSLFFSSISLPSLSQLTFSSLSLSFVSLIPSPKLRTTHTFPFNHFHPHTMLNLPQFFFFSSAFSLASSTHSHPLEYTLLVLN